MKICFFIPHFPRVGGYELQALSLAHELSERGHDVTLTTNFRADMNQPESVEGLPLFAVKPLPAFRSNPVTFTSAALKFLAKKKRRPDILHCHAVSSVTGAYIAAAKILSIPSIVKVATLNDVKNINKDITFGLGVLQGVSLKADKIIALSDEIKQECQSKKVDEKKIIRLFNGVDTKKFYPGESDKSRIRSSLKLSPNDFIALYIARLEIRKGVYELISIWRKAIKQLGENATLIIAGDGRERSRLEELAKTNGLEKSVLFAGEVKNPQEYFQAADVFLFPSLREGSPNALMEAMASALPCLASAIPGITEVARNGETAILIEPKDEETFAAKLVELKNDPALREKLGSAARKHVEEHFSISKLAEIYEAVYNELKQNAKR